MPVFVDPQTGKKFNNDRPDAGELAAKWGLIPQEQYDQQKPIDDAGEGTGLQSLGEGIERGVGAMAAGIQKVTGFGTAPGLVDNEQGEQLPGGGLGAIQGAYSHEADLRRQAHPLLSGAGEGLGMAPAIAAAGALGAAALPAEIPVVGGAIGGLLGESAAQATQTEYDDAWFQKRPMEASNVAAYTMLFAGGDLLFRGALSGAKRLIFGAEPTATSLGGRNLISEAQGAARDAAPHVAPTGGGGSVGAASATDLVEPFDHAIRTMSDKDAAVLARDANDHLHLVSQDASEAMTRVNQGLSDNLGSQLKYEDFATNAQQWEAPLLERQSKWLDEMTSKGDAIARELTAADSQAAGPRTPQGQRPSAPALDYGNLGRKAAQIIDTFNQRITEETDPARRNYLADSVKKQLDGLTNSIDSSFGVDQVTRTDLKAIIGPFREELRNGLMNPKYWGANAEMQRALNGPWTQLLEHWSKVQNTLLEATGHTAFDQMGAGRITKESTVDRMRALFSKDPRANQEMGKHLAGAFDGLQGLIEARQAHGIANTDGLDAMAGDVRNLMEDWNLATTVGVAQNRVANLKRDPRKWGSLALDLGERLPLVGKPIHVARSLGDAFTDLHLERGKALGNLWDQGYRRFAQNPALQDPSISSNYADWILDALRQRGGNVPVPPAGNMGAPMEAAANVGQGGFRQAAQPAAAEPGMHWTQTAPAESVDDYLRRQQAGRAPAPTQQPPTGSLFDKQTGASAVPDSLRDRVGAGRVDTPDQARAFLGGQNRGQNVSRGAVDAAPTVGGGGSVQMSGGGPGGSGVGVNPESRTSGTIPRDIFTPHVGSVAEGGIFHERLTGPQGKTPGGMFRGTDGVTRYIKADKDAAHSAIEAGNARMYAALGRKVPELQAVQLPSGEHALASEAFGPEWKELDKIPDWSALPKSVRDSYAEGVPVDFIMGNWDVSRNARNIMTDGQSTLMVDPGEAATNAWGTKWYEGNAQHADKELRRGLGYGHGGGEGLIPEPVGTPPHELLRGYAQSEGELRGIMGKGFERAVGVIDQAGGTEAFVREHQPTLAEPEVKRAAAEMTERIAKFKTALPFFAGAVYLAFGPNAKAAEPDRPPPPAQPPLPAYSGALREINKAGDAQIQAFASSMLRKRDPGAGGKTPLALFGGRRSMQDAVEGVRQRLEQIAGDPAALVQTLAGSVGDLWKTHPTVYDALVQKSTEIANYLHANLPARTATTLMDPVGGVVSFDRAWDFAAKFVGAVQPKAAIREVVRGTAPPEMLEALQTNHPELWDGLRAHVLGQVQRLADAGRHIPSEKLARLDRELGMDGQLDPSMSLAVASHFLAAQDAEAQKRQQTGKSGKMPPSSGGSSFRTPLDAINNERANAS
jgi:hypothetical protein